MKVKFLTSLFLGDILYNIKEEHDLDEKLALEFVKAGLAVAVEVKEEVKPKAAPKAKTKKSE